jgi:D-alanyl-lipoteichoic acid acyltransferase DltB (MBOAT superfamily)
MLFNSYGFIFLFLPITFFVFFALGKRHLVYASAWLTAASLFFYGWWNPKYVALLLASIGANYCIGYYLANRSRDERFVNRKRLLGLGIACNLLLLGYFKYTNFFVDSYNSLTGANLVFGEIILPLGISFFTFTQIAFLVDTYEGKVKEYNFVHYALFVTYFPHLIAGPVLHHKEMMPQFANAENYRRNNDAISIGLTLFAIGLFKKAVLADGIAPYANSAFSGAASGQSLTLFEAWGGALAYTFQLYFDFSGYSDMAIGLSRMFGIRLPLNFDSPYKSRNIIEFWRRWHMTLSRFLRDYLYFALGGNRNGVFRRYVNLMITMVLGGLWHGAGWNFAIWGGLHGFYLIINHAWQSMCKRLGLQAESNSKLGYAVAIGFTFLAVVVGWVFFRAANVDAALAMLAGMAGLNGVALPIGIAGYIGSLADVVRRLGIDFTLGGGTNFVMTYSWVLALSVVTFCLPNSQQFMSRHDPSLVAASAAGPDVAGRQDGVSRLSLRWRPSWPWALGIAVLLSTGLLTLSRATEFLYFQF